MCNSGGGAQGETRYNWNEDMAPRWNNLLNFGLNTGFNIAEDGSIHAKPRAEYGGQRFTNVGQYGDNINMGQGGDLGEIQGYQRALMRGSSNPLGAMNAARGQIEGTLEGDYLSGANKNPNASLNPQTGVNSSTTRNLFAGNTPYFRDTMLSGMNDIAEVYKNATDPSLRAAAVLNGTYGGGDHIAQQAKNEDALGKNLSRYADSMLNQQYDRSANLEESFLGRDLGAQQYNQNLTNQNYENALNRGFNAFENERGRQMGMVGAGQNEQNLAYGRMDPLLGTMNTRMGLDQRQLDYYFDQFNQQQNYPYTLMDQLSGLYGRAMGGGGMNTQVYGPSGNSAAPYLGAALAGYSLFGR